MKQIKLTAHASQQAARRGIPLPWLYQTIRSPAWTEADPTDAEKRRCFSPVPEHEGRVLRVVCVETEREIRVITAFFDRDARPPWPT